MLTTYVINMPNRIERRRNMVALMGRLGIKDFTFVTPVDKGDLPPGFETLPPGYASLNATVSVRIFDMQRGKAGPFLVFEDDAIERLPAEEILPHIDEILRSIPPSWDMVYLEYCLEKCSAMGHSVVSKAHQPYCTAAMLYNSESIDRVRRCLATEKKLIDFSYARCIAGDPPLLNAFVSTPALFAQDAAYGAGDLAHLNPDNIQWWLNLVIRLYPDADNVTSEPRLPACWNSKEILKYVRWWNVFVIAVLIIAVIWATVWHLRRL